MPDRTNLKVGKPDTTPSAPSHVEGVRQGNQPGSFDETPGLQTPSRAGQGRALRSVGKGTARRSTAINPSKRDPIDPSMPNLSPP